MLSKVVQGATSVNNVSIVTGAARGVGAAVAKLFASKGHNIIISYLTSETEAMETASECEKHGAEVLAVKADVSIFSDCRKIVDAAIKRWGRIDQLVNSAGVTSFNDYSDLNSQTPELFNSIMNVNVLGPFSMSQCVAPYMESQGKGSIVNISSNAGLTGMGSSISYATSKGALNTLTLALARALSPEIRVNAICPGVIASTWWNARIPEVEKRELFFNSQAEASPLNTILKPEDVAKTVLYLFENEHISGELIRLDAGTHLGNSKKKNHSKEKKGPALR